VEHIAQLRDVFGYISLRFFLKKHSRYGLQLHLWEAYNLWLLRCG